MLDTFYLVQYLSVNRENELINHSSIFNDDETKEFNALCCQNVHQFQFIEITIHLKLKYIEILGNTYYFTNKQRGKKHFSK